MRIVQVHSVIRKDFRTEKVAQKKLKTSKTKD